MCWKLIIKRDRYQTQNILSNSAVLNDLINNQIEKKKLLWTKEYNIDLFVNSIILLTIYVKYDAKNYKMNKLQVGLKSRKSEFAIKRTNMQQNKLRCQSSEQKKRSVTITPHSRMTSIFLYLHKWHLYLKRKNKQSESIALAKVKFSSAKFYQAWNTDLEQTSCAPFNSSSLKFAQHNDSSITPGPGSYTIKQSLLHKQENLKAQNKHVQLFQLPSGQYFFNSRVDRFQPHQTEIPGCGQYSTNYSMFKKQQRVVSRRIPPKRQSLKIPTIPSKFNKYGYKQIFGKLTRISNPNQKQRPFNEKLEYISTPSKQQPGAAKSIEVQRLAKLTKSFLKISTSLDKQYDSFQRKKRQNMVQRVTKLKLKSQPKLAPAPDFELPGPGQYQKKNPRPKQARQKYQFFGSSSDRFEPAAKQAYSTKCVRKQVPRRPVKLHPKIVPSYRLPQKQAAPKRDILGPGTYEQSDGMYFNLKKRLEKKVAQSSTLDRSKQIPKASDSPLGPGTYDIKQPVYYQRRSSLCSSTGHLSESNNRYSSHQYDLNYQLIYGSIHHKSKVLSNKSIKNPFGSGSVRFQSRRREREIVQQVGRRRKNSQTSQKRGKASFGREQRFAEARQSQFPGPGEYRGEKPRKSSFNIKYI